MFVVAMAAVSVLGTGPSAELGGLHRTAAVLDQTLDVYRLALVDLVPAALRLEEAGTAAGAAPSTPVPEPASAIFKRLATSVLSRIPAKALPATVRAYHAEVIAALEDLALAGTLDGSAASLRSLEQAMRRITDSAEQVVDLFSRKRPLELRVVDPSTALDDIGEALDEVAAAERAIAVMRKRRAAMGTELQAFMRLEVSLGHALDLIAAAEEAGIEIGFTMQMSTASFAGVLSRVRAQLNALDAVLVRMERAPASMPAVSVLVVPAKGGAEAHVAWLVPAVGLTAVARIYRRPNLDSLMEKIIDAYRCEGKAADRAAQLAQQDVEQMAEAWQRVGEQPAGRLVHVEAMTEMPLAPPIYRVAAVSAFGVESASAEVAAVVVPAELSGPSWVRARALAPPPSAPHFYRDYDVVEVGWGRSDSDSGAAPDVLQAIAERKLPHVVGYRVLRWRDAEVHVVGDVPAGTMIFRERVAPEALAHGVRYSVEAVGAQGERSTPPAKCRTSEPVHHKSIMEELRLARAGRGRLEQPTQVERRAREALAEPTALAKATAEFRARPQSQQHALTTAWWQGVSVRQRTLWLKAWPSLVGPHERAAWLAETPAHLRERDRTWAMLEVWLSGEPEEVRREISRTWDLMTEVARHEAMRTWLGALNRDHRTWLTPHLDEPEAGEHARQARVMAWWRSRDGRDREVVEDWWQEIHPSLREQAVAEWLKELPEVVRASVRWPDWAQLTQSERDALLNEPPRLPAGLMPDFLAWLAWRTVEEAGGDALVSAVGDEVGGVAAAWTRLRFATRPLDVRLGFALPWVAPLGLLLILAAAYSVRVRRRRRAFVPPAGERGSH